MARIVIEEPCPEHGLVDRHCICNDLPGDPQHGEWCYCQGTRRVFTEGEYVLIEKVDGEWPEDAIRTMTAAWINSPHPTLGHQIIDGLDALAGGESPNPQDNG